jgi:hypothetical protein
MAYPDKVDRFAMKLNRKPAGGNYVVEEQLVLDDGKYEGLLIHDNIPLSSIQVYTGPKFSGKPITNFTVSIPSDTPWRRGIRIFAACSEVFVTYETPGDTVEAEDINLLQTAVTATQAEVERYKEAGRIDGGTFTREG